MADVAARLMTVDAFLVVEGEDDTRYQLVRGDVTAMAQARVLHGEMVVRLAGLIGSALPRRCRLIAEA